MRSLATEDVVSLTKIIHLTDIHLDWHEGVEANMARRALEGLDADAPIILTGDISTGPTFARALLAFAEGCGERTIYFVLGNHDAWQTGIARSRQAAGILARKHTQLVYLPAAGVVGLSPTTCLVGLDGWYDARAGDVNGSSVYMNDFELVEELHDLHPGRRREELQARGQRDARRAREMVEAAFAHYDHMVFATHVAPIPAAAVYQGKPSDAAHQPYYVNFSLGLALSDVTTSHPDKRVTVLCGHSHGAADVQVADNFRVITGAAAYGRVAVSGVWEV